MSTFVDVRNTKQSHQRKVHFLACCLNYTWTRAVPHSHFEDPSFRALFDPFHRLARSIVTVANRPSIRSEILELGEFAKTATTIERKRHMGAVTTDHWTGPGQAAQTYSVTTYRYICCWKICLFPPDFKVSEGTTSGEAVFEDQREVLSLTAGEGALFVFLL